MHTAIENHLVEAVGDPGKRVHTGRSRNDQVLAALRLWSRGFLFAFQRACLELVEKLLDFAEKHSLVPMPGRTHMQIAMPSSVGLWAGAFAEELLDDAALARNACTLLDCCPLGSAASYGVPLPLNREMVADLLGFARVQNNVLYANNSRGKFESIALEAVEQAVLTLSKMAQDLILFSLPELGYFSLPPSSAPGRASCPRKRIRTGWSWCAQKAPSSPRISSRSRPPSGPCRAATTGISRRQRAPFSMGAKQVLPAWGHGPHRGQAAVNAERLRAAITPEIYATDRAFELVAKGMPFRDAYREVGRNLGALAAEDPAAAIAARKSSGTTGNLRLDVPRARAAEHLAWMDGEEKAKRAAIYPAGRARGGAFPRPPALRPFALEP